MLAKPVSTPNKLDARQISQHAQVEGLDVVVFDSLPSTNSWLLEHPVETGAARLCITEEQTAGRGRRGNIWQSEPYQNIMLSLAWSFPSWPSAITGLSLAAGMVVAEQLNVDYGLSVKVKWPNDLLVNDKKLGGILIELAGESGGACQVVIGLGLNVNQPRWDQSADYQWQDLQGLGVQCDRNQLVGRLCKELINALQAFEEHGFARLVPAWPGLSSYQNRKISVGLKKSLIEGEMIGVDEEGALLVRSGDGKTHRFADSNVSIRLVA